MADGWGGKRPGAGRKKKQTTIIRERALEQAGEDAKYALGLFVALMRDEARAMDSRLMAGKEVMDRVWGKATYRTEVSGPDGGPLEVRDMSDEELASIAAGGGDGATEP